MGGPNSGGASIQAFFPLTPNASSPSKSPNHPQLPPVAPRGDGFTTDELHTPSVPGPTQSWVPPHDYTETDISSLHGGPQAVTFMGRVANVFDLTNTPKTPRSARGCVKLCVKDDGAAITVRASTVA